MERFVSVFGILLVLAICYALSTNRKAIQGRTILWGLGMQFVLALFVLKTPFGQAAFSWVGDKITRLLELSYVGSAFVFGKIGMKGGGDTNVGFIFATQIVPAILFVAALFAVLYHLGVMQLVVRGVAKVMTRLMGASGAESLNVAASIFMGQTEAPFTIRPFLNKMTQSELMCVMTSGMAHVSGGIMAAYIGYGIEAKHLLAAVIMTAPGTILLAKMLVPETGKPETAGDVNFSSPKIDTNVIGAAARGTGEGLQLALNVVAMLITFLALVALVNVLLGALGGVVGMPWLSLQWVLGWLFAPLALAMGIPWGEARIVGNLMGTRLVLNELIAYGQLGPLRETLSPRTFTMATYALCGFANLGSVGIQIGGIGALIPERRNDLAALGLRALLAGTLANFITACIAGVLL
jgi:CNT family concentrative nucleoside transporter